MTRPADVPPRPLTAGEPQQRSFADDTPHAYEVKVAAGDLLRVTTQQLGVDVKVRLFAPGGRQVMVMDSPTGKQGPETVSAVAETAGTWRVEVHPFDHGPGADYEIRIDDLRPAGDEARRRVAAEQAFAAAEELRRDDDYARAEKRYRDALRGFRAVGDLAADAHCLHRLGLTYLRRGELRKAHEHFELALTKFRQLGDDAWQLAVLNRLGSILRQSGRLDEALTAHREAVAISRRLDDPLLRAASLDLLGDVYRWSQRFDEASSCYREALDLWTDLPDRQHKAAATWIRIGELYLSQNRLEEARDAMQRARELAPDNRNLLTVIHTHLGSVAYRADRLDAARDHMADALRLADEGDDARAQALAHSALGTLCLKTGDHEGCKDHLETALSLFRELEDDAMEGSMLHKLGRLAYAQGDLDAAMDLHREAVAILQRVGDRQGVAASRYAIARIHHRREEYEAARDELESALRSASELRGDAEGPDLQASYVDSKHHYWELYVDSLMHLEEAGYAGSADRALAVTESWRARGLVEMLEEAGVDVERGVDERLLEHKVAVQKRLNAAEMRRVELLHGDPAERAAVERQRMELLNELRHVRSEIRRSSPLLRHINPRSDLSLLHSSAVSDVQQWHLNANTVVLVYALGDERSFAWTVTVDGTRHHVLPSRREIEELAASAVDLLRSPAPSKAERRQRTSTELADRVLTPLLEGLDDPLRYRRLIVVPDGALLYVPFAALPLPSSLSEAGGDRAPAIERYELVHLPSIATLIALRSLMEKRRQSQHTSPQAAAVLVDPVFRLDDPRLRPTDRPDAPDTVVAEPDTALRRSMRDVGLDELHRLPATAREAAMIRQLMPPEGRGEVFVAEGFDADRELVLSGRLADYRILHFATHGMVDRDHPELSGLVLSLFDRQGRAQPGFLRLHEIYDLRLPAELVVLSACETGVGRRYRGEGMVGLTRGFMYAGTPRVVVSLWQVEDESTAELMWRFYDLLLAQRRQPAAALRLAQLSMQRDPRWSAPYHWAGFVFVGDPVLERALDDPIEATETGADEDPNARADDELPIPDIPQRPGSAFPTEEE